MSGGERLGMSWLIKDARRLLWSATETRVGWDRASEHGVGPLRGHARAGTQDASVARQTMTRRVGTECNFTLRYSTPLLFCMGNAIL